MPPSREHVRQVRYLRRNTSWMQKLRLIRCPSIELQYLPRCLHVLAALVLPAIANSALSRFWIELQSRLLYGPPLKDRCSSHLSSPGPRTVSPDLRIPDSDSDPDPDPPLQSSPPCPRHHSVYRLGWSFPTTPDQSSFPRDVEKILHPCSLGADPVAGLFPAHPDGANRQMLVRSLVGLHPVFRIQAVFLISPRPSGTEQYRRMYSLPLTEPRNRHLTSGTFELQELWRYCVIQAMK